PQGAHIWLGVFRSAASLGAAYALAGRTTDALSLLEQVVEQAMAMGFLLDHALRVASLSEAYLLAGRLDEADIHAQRALEFCRAPAGTSPLRGGPAAPGRGRRAASPAGGRASRSPLPAGPRSGRGAGHAPAPGPLPPRPRDAVC